MTGGNPDGFAGVVEVPPPLVVVDGAAAVTVCAGAVAVTVCCVCGGDECCAGGVDVAATAEVVVAGAAGLRASATRSGAPEFASELAPDPTTTPNASIAITATPAARGVSELRKPPPATARRLALALDEEVVLARLAPAAAAPVTAPRAAAAAPEPAATLPSTGATYAGTAPRRAPH